MYGDIIENESSRETESIKVVSTSQYNSISRFVINQKDLALVEYYYSFNLLGEPEKFDLTINQLYNNQMDFFVKYEKINDKYYPTQLTKKQEVIFTKSKDYKDIDYTLNSFTEFVLFDFNSECQDSAFSNEYLFYEEFYEYHKSKITTDSSIPQFDDLIRDEFESNLK